MIPSKNELHLLECSGQCSPVLACELDLTHWKNVRCFFLN